MLKWNRIDQDLLKPGAWLGLNHRDKNPANEAMAKRILGLDAEAVLPGFEYDLTVFGSLNECFFAARFEDRSEYGKVILASGQAVPVRELFAESACRDDILNLFDREDAASPDLSMLQNFIKSNMKDFQILNASKASFWMSKWSNVNSWACYWKVDDTFHCLAKQSG